MKDSDWIILDELYKNPNITKVAGQLYITQPTLTKRLQAIEDEFQIRIVNRSTKGVEFTREGEYLAAQAKQYLRFMKETRDGIRGLKKEGCGTIRIAASYTFSKFQLSEILYSYGRLHPNLCFEIQNLRSHELMGLVADGEADVGFVRGNYDISLKKCLILRENAYVLCKSPITLDRLPELPMVRSALGNYTQRVMDQWWNQHFDTPPNVDTLVQDVDICWRLVSRGIGYTLSFLQEYQLQELGMFYLPMLHPDGSHIERNTWFVYDGHKAAPDYVTDFIRHIEGHYAIESA